MRRELAGSAKPSLRILVENHGDEKGAVSAVQLPRCNRHGAPWLLQRWNANARGTDELLWFEESNIDILVDDPSDDKSYEMSTNPNIHAYLSKLIDGAESGDILVFHFSGHGGSIPATKGDNDATGMDEMIFPFDHTNPLSDEDFRDVVSTISEGVNFTFITDSCCSGGLIDEMKAHVGGKEQIEDLESHIEAWKACTGQCARR
uniref:Peptidase C14 caspase domain-containing protein n=2 Tax=Physcomitrium patens TaxID=3218 RepID=A0A2K1KCR5_PHYPA|nr:hypothetical protein PHYPA_010761 [Physcomitrium patens]